MKENSVKISNIDEYGIKIKRGKSIIKIEVSTKFNWLQKKLWKYLLNIDIEDIKEDK